MAGDREVSMLILQGICPAFQLADLCADWPALVGSYRLAFGWAGANRGRYFFQNKYGRISVYRGLA